MKIRYSIAMTLPLASASAMAADLAVKVEIPQLNVAEYHRPYIAAWIENADNKVVSNLSVLLDMKKDANGSKWAKDLRTWWRKSGKELKLPVDGVSGATKAPGEHTLAIPASVGVDKLPAGKYTLIVEASREAGGRELVKVPLTWPLKQAASAKGTEELGNVTVTYK